MENNYVIPGKLLAKVLNVIYSRPYAEVASIASELNMIIGQQNETFEVAAKQSKEETKDGKTDRDKKR
jgi:hypothetical protein